MTVSPLRRAVGVWLPAPIAKPRATPPTSPMLTERTAGTSSSVTTTLTPSELSPMLMVISPSSVEQSTGPVGPVSPLTMICARPGGTVLAGAGAGGLVGATTGVEAGLGVEVGAQPTRVADTTVDIAIASTDRTDGTRISVRLNGPPDSRPAAAVPLLRYCRG